MKDPWACTECGGEMIKTSPEWLCCTNGCGKLYPAPRIEDLPYAIPALQRGPKTRMFHIDGQYGLWQYVKYAHANALEAKPAPGHVVAKVFVNQKQQARVFQRAPSDAKNHPTDAAAQAQGRPADRPNTYAAG